MSDPADVDIFGLTRQTWRGLNQPAGHLGPSHRRRLQPGDAEPHRRTRRRPRLICLRFSRPNELSNEDWRTWKADLGTIPHKLLNPKLPNAEEGHGAAPKSAPKTVSTVLGRDFRAAPPHADGVWRELL